MIRKELRWYVFLVVLVIALMLITHYISQRHLQELEESKPSIGIRRMVPCMRFSDITFNTI